MKMFYLIAFLCAKCIGARHSIVLSCRAFTFIRNNLFIFYIFLYLGGRNVNEDFGDFYPSVFCTFLSQVYLSFCQELSSQNFRATCVKISVECVHRGNKAMQNLITKSPKLELFH